MSEIKSWFTNWRSHLLELFIAALTVCSGLTTFLGARKLVNGSWLVAALFTAGVQGSMYIVTHRATIKETGPRRRRIVALYAAWLLLAVFSVYASALGMFEMQMDSLRNDHQHTSFTSEWRAAVEQIAAFRAQSLAVLRARSRDTALQLTFEKNKEQSHRRARRAYSPKERQTLNARLVALADAERRIAAMKPLASAPVENIHEARLALDAAFSQAADLFAALPDDCRAQVSIPRRSFGQTVPVDLQKAFWMELQMRSAPALFMLVIAFLLDFLPLGIRYACRPRRTLAESIRASRLAMKNVGSALIKPIRQEHVSVRLEVEDYHELDVEVTFADDGAGPYLEDLKRHFETVERAVMEIEGEPMRVAEARTPSGETVSPDAPLLAQLDDERTIRLLVAPAGAEI